MNGAKNDAEGNDRGSTLVWDTSTLRKGLQRQIFSSLMEMSGWQVMIVEQTARELAPLVDPKAPANGLKALYAGFDDPEPIRHALVYRSDPRTSIKHQIWWAEELARPDGLYRTVVLDEAATARYDTLMDSFCAARALPNLTEDEVREHPDAISICKAAAIDGKIIVSPDQDFQADRLAANAWAVAQHRAGALNQPMIVTRPERELEDWCATDPHHVLRSIIGAGWPSDPQATRPTIEARLDTLFENMAKVDYLRSTATFCRQLYTNHAEPSQLIEEVRANLPVRARAADARHPANPENTARNWAEPDEAVRPTAELPRWRLYVTTDRFHIEENRSGNNYTPVEEIPIRDRQRIIKALIDRRIEVQGMPTHGGSLRQGGSGGFVVAMNSLIDEELAKSRARTR